MAHRNIFGNYNYLLFIVILVVGCSSRPPSASRESLMPDSIAKGIVAKLLGNDWANAPFFSPDIFCSKSSSVKYYYGYDKIFRVVYFERTKRLRISAGDNQWLPCSYGVYWKDSIERNEAIAIQDALVGMGAVHFQTGSENLFK